VTYFVQEQLLPYKRTTEMMVDLFGVHLSQGTIKNILERAHNALWDFELRMIALMISLGLLHFDETGIYVKRKGNKYWLHIASTETLTLLHADKRRGRLGMIRMGILPKFKGTAVHDNLQAYFTFLCKHVLCNAHHLRELVYAHEQYQQEWALKLLECLVEANVECIAAREEGAKSLPPERVAYFSSRYDEILEAGKKEVQLLPAPKPAKTKKKSGRVKEHKVTNLYNRLIARKAETLAFVSDLSLPFTNNQAERDGRMTKAKLKISGVFRSILGAKMFARARSYTSTARKQKINVLDALISLFDGTAGTLFRRMTRRPKKSPASAS
jgi:transposase